MATKKPEIVACNLPAVEETKEFHQYCKRNGLIFTFQLTRLIRAEWERIQRLSADTNDAA